MREIATTLTDYGLTIATAAAALSFVYRPTLYRGRGPAMFFAGIALATLFGGTWHGFFSAPGARAEGIVWWLSMLFMGMSAGGLAITGLELLSYKVHRKLLTVFGVLWIAFSVYLWFDTRFLPNLVATGCGTLVCLVGLARQFHHGAIAPASMAMVGLGVSIVAALAQQRGVALDPVYFDHNATYHVLLLVGLGLVYPGFRRIRV